LRHTRIRKEPSSSSRRVAKPSLTETTPRAARTTRWARPYNRPW
jgi:hypothetical protein